MVIMKTAYVYARFSTKRQELGDSLVRQIKRAEDYCKQNNLELSETTFEDLGISAYKTKSRPGLEDLLNCIKHGSIPSDSYVLLENTDRLSRKGYKHALDLMEQLVSTGATIAMVDTGQVYTKQNMQQLSTALPLLLDADRAHLESERKSALIKSAKNRVRDNNVVIGKQPFWIDLVDGKPVLNEKSVIVEKMIDMRLQGFSAQKIAKELTKQGYKSPTGKSIGSALVKITTANHAIYGAKQYNITDGNKLVPVKLTDGLYPALCTRSTYLAIQYNKGNASKGRASTTSPFSKLFKCALCGSALTTRTTVVKGKKYTYRRCIGNLEGRCSCGATFKEIDSIMLEQLAHLKYKHVTTKTESNLVEELQSKLDTLNQTKALIKNPVALADIYDDIADTQQRLTVALADREIADSASDVDFKYIVDLDDTTKQNTLLRRVIDSIVFSKPNRKQCKVEVNFKNKHRIRFIIEYKRGMEYKVLFKSDTENYSKWLKELTKD